jgi:hypothetical protein
MASILTFRRARAVCVIACVAMLAPAWVGGQTRIEGRVVNGTTQRPAANQKVILLVPRQGMEQVADATTDSRGHFVLTPSGSQPSSFYLMQAIVQGVPYHATAQLDSAGKATVNLTVYDSMRDPAAIRVSALRVLVAAQGQRIRVQEAYQVENSSQRTYADADGTFVFQLSPQAGAPSVTVTGLDNMALPQTAERGKSPGEYKIRYALKPGITPVTVGYEADYTAAQFSLSDRAPFAIEHAQMFVFPSSLKVESKIFKPSDADPAHDIQTFEAGSVARGASVEASLSGAGASTPRPGDSPADQPVKSVPNTMTRLGLPLFACFLLILLWALGVRVSKEWSRWKERKNSSPARKQLEAKAETLLNSLADLDELFATGKIEKKQYWKERLELKAKLMAILKKGPPVHIEPYATRRNPT